MTEQEYKKNIIRMWNSVRKNEYKGQITCLGVRCEDCPLWGICQDCSHSVDVSNPYKAIEAVKNWSREHPVVTNAEKFKEVFGFDMTICWNNEFPCNECQFCDIDGTCNSKDKFWDAEYKEQTKE